MFPIGKANPKTDAPNRSAREASELKHPKPKVLLLDIDDGAAEALADKGFNVTRGTFGTPYKVPKSGNYPIIGRAKLPNHQEQEIVVVDLHVEEYDAGPSGEKHWPDSEPDLWAKCHKGFIDPRPRAMWQVREAFDRILGMGGVFVIFADAKQHQEVQYACLSGGHFPRLYDERPFHGDIWDFLSTCQTFEIGDDRGEEMTPSDTSTPLGKLVAEHLRGGRFNCTVSAPNWSGEGWRPLCQNKFKHSVGVAWLKGQEGTVIILPQLRDKTAFLTGLFVDILPELAPHLFPYVERGLWTHRPEYELPRVLELKAKQIEVEERARANLATLERELENERATSGWIHNILTGTDAQLVEAVKKAFAVLGFGKIVDVDEERDKESMARREDLQIHSHPIAAWDGLARLMFARARS
ncbi:MAG: hypothetical protein M3436_18680 [Pseudomonadota bacterium]|nr:hypothetical protein [Pseudomonadota bacterium]